MRHKSEWQRAFQQLCTMYSNIRTYSYKEIQFYLSIQSLQASLLRFSFMNLLVVALIGLLMRSFPFLNAFPLEYKNILHGHSHFAFGGWVMPVLLALFLKTFPELAEKVSYHHWRNIAVLMLASAYGMLISFPLQGYKTVSITFSTLSITAGYYMAIKIWKAMKEIELKIPHRFIQWGLVYFVLSAIGPFATGPLIAMGKQGSPLYFDAIYFYLHFQYNGFFTFFVLAVLYKVLERKGFAAHGKKVFWFFNLACVPTYALSILWNEPSFVFNLLGGVGAFLQFVGFVFLLKDVKAMPWKKNRINFLLLLSLVAFTVKLALQFFSAFPAIASLAYHQRNFVIAYLHLVLLGFISTFVFAQVFDTMKNVKAVKQGLLLFLFSFASTELLLVLNAFSVSVPYYAPLLALFTVFFPLGILRMNVGLRKAMVAY